MEFDGSVSDAIIDQYFGHNKGYQLIKHQIDSYNDFVLRKLELIVEGFNPIENFYNFMSDIGGFSHVLTVTIENVMIGKPTIYEKDGSTKIMMPNDARLRNLTYSSSIFVDVVVNAKTWNSETKEYSVDFKRINNVCIGKLPVMVRSRYCMLTHQKIPSHVDECKHDYGGYFIINGNEKTIISQDRIAENKTYVFMNKGPMYSHTAEIRSVHESRCGVPKTTTVKLSSKANNFGRYIRVTIHHVKHDIPLFILFRALGVQSDKDIVKHIVYDLDDMVSRVLIKELGGSIDEASSVTCMRDAYEYMLRYMHTHGQPKEYLVDADHRIGILHSVISNEFLPHVGKSMAKKAIYLGYMVNKMLKCYVGLRNFDDRDSYINKRIDTPGMLLSSLFRQYYGKVIKDMRNSLYKEIHRGSWKATNNFINIINKANVYKVIKPSVIETGLKYGLATGNWGIKTNRMRLGVAQVLNRMTYVAMLSHLRRINTPIEKTGKLVQPRKLHSTQWGVICPSETPEGASIGLVKNLATMASITIAASCKHIVDIMLENGLVPCVDAGSLCMMLTLTRVFVNGDIVGCHHNAAELIELLRGLKRRGAVPVYTSFAWDVFHDELLICTEGGRCVRPLVIVSSLAKLGPDARSAILAGKVSWSDMVLGTGPVLRGASLIEYIDVEEANCSMIAMTYEDVLRNQAYTHVEIKPCLMLGVVAGSIPFSDHNQAPRNTYQSAMGKQAIGIYATNYRHRFDTIAHILNYPQRPLVYTKIGRIMNCDDLPCGINAIVAIATYTGFNQEDSIIMNMSAVQRGLFVSTFFKTYREINNKNHSSGEEEFFCCPDPALTKNMKPYYNYDKLNSHGFVEENQFVTVGDVIIGKCMPHKQGNVMCHKDTSIIMRNNEKGFVDRNCYDNKYFTNVNSDGYTFAKVKIRNERVPSIGDKFSSRHGQKGTIGMLYKQEDMPFSINGIAPDIIINPHAIPSRMTIGQLMECILGKSCCATGQFGDATPFGSITAESICDALAHHGMERTGNDILHNSRTGQQIPTTVFMGPTYYQRLKHMVEDKIHSRAANGPVVLLTRQPAEGRARDGGLRLGEMEIECNWAHGTMHFLKERFMECSDNYRAFVCVKCNMMATVNPDRNIRVCKHCKNMHHFKEVRLPYACKLLFQEVQAMGITTRFSA